MVCPLPSNRHHPSSGDCLEGKGENYQVCSVQYWSDLQSVHWFRCYDNIHVCKLTALYTLQMRIASNAKCQRVLVLALCLLDVVVDAISLLQYQCQTSKLSRCCTLCRYVIA